MSIRAVPKRRFGLIWGGDLHKLAALDEARIAHVGDGWRSLFYGLGIGPVAIGILLRRRVPSKPPPEPPSDELAHGHGS